jgi:hypothetical protein
LCDRTIFEGLLHFKMGDFDATLDCFQRVLYFCSTERPLNMPCMALLQGVATWIRFENPSDLCSRILYQLELLSQHNSIPFSLDARILFYWFMRDLEFTAIGLPGLQGWHIWWNSQDDLPTTKCSMLLEDLVSVKRWVVCESGERVSAARACLARIRSSFEPSAWLGPMLL